MSVKLDHILWAAPDLDAGSALLAKTAGVAPARGGSHPGFGTRSSLLSLGDTYLEVIAPDPAQPLQGNRGGVIAAMPRPGLITFAVRTTDLAAYTAAAEKAGVGTREPIEMSRTRPDGVKLEWACTFVEHAVYGEAVPFAIDWRASPHPSGTTPKGCELLEFTVLQPEPEPLAAIYAAMGIPVTVKAAAAPGFLATIATTRGTLVLTQA